MSGGSDASTQQQVAQYYMSVHVGICAGPIDELDQIVINDKVAYSGVVSSTKAITIDQPSLFGGIKENGGCGGVVDIYLGADDQLVSFDLATRLGSVGTYTTASATTSGVAGSYVLTTSDVTNATPGHLIFVAPIAETGTGALTVGTTIEKIEGSQITLSKPVLTTFAVDGTTGNYPQLTWTVSVDGIGNTPTTVPGFRNLASMFFHSGQGSQVPIPGPYYYFPETGTSGPDASNANAPTTETLAHGGFYWIANYPAIPRVSSRQTRFPIGPNGDKFRNSDGSANPAHMIWECLTNADWGLGAPVGLLDVVSFQACATQLQSESFGLCMLWTRSDYVENFIAEILNHIQAVLTVNPATGRLIIKLLRADYDTTTLPIVHPGNAKMTNWQRKTWGETGNEVTVTYTDPTNYEAVSVTAQDNGLIAIQGAVISTARSYYGVINGSLAAKLAQRDLRQSATPLLAVELEVNREAATWIVGEVIELRWPEYGVVSMWLRIISMNYGKPGASTIKVNALEDIFGFGTALYSDLPVDDPSAPPPRATPPDVPTYAPAPSVPVFVPPAPEGSRGASDETPRTLDYLYLGDALYYCVAVAVGDDRMAAFSYPQSVDMVLTGQNGTTTSVIGMWVEKTDSTGAISYVNIQNRPNMSHGLLAGALVQEEVSTIAALTSPGGAPPVNGQLMLLQNPSDPTIQELCIIEAFNTDLTFTVWRGILDTHPRSWPIGTLAWIFPAGGASFDPTIRPVGVVANYKFTPKTSEGMLPLASAPVRNMTVNERVYQPYRPSNVVLDGQLWATPSPTQGDVVVTFNRRNRVNETARILKWTDLDVPPETNQVTVVSVHKADGTQVVRYTGITGNTFTIPEVAFLLTGGPTALVRVGSERYDVSLSATFECFQKVERAVDLSHWVFAGYGKAYGAAYGA